LRYPHAFLISTGVSLAGLLVAACGATHSATTISAPSTSPAAAHAAPAAMHPRIAFVSPRPHARVGSALHVRVHRSEAGRVRFVLDGHNVRVTAATTLVYRHLAPGAHRLQAELLPASGTSPAATASVDFRVRRSLPPPSPVTPAGAGTGSPAPAPAPVATQTTASPPPPPATTTTPAASPPPPPAATTTPAAPPTGIPQNGGGDGDSDNHGAPSDGDGNV
jgi:hypothetical protein